MPTSSDIAKLTLSGDQCLIIAEVAQAHDGSLGTAHAYIDAVAKAGANAVKFQTHIAAAESTPGEPWRVKFSPQDETRYEYWQRMEFTESQWHGLKQHADESGLWFLSSPFSNEAVELLNRVGVAAWKVASGEVGNLPMLRQMAKTQLPCILSTGMNPIEEIDAAVKTVRQHDAEVAVLQCTTAYPCPPEKIGLNVLEQLRSRYECPVGLSDHSGTIYPSLAAATLHANILEVHVTFSRETFGPDVPASVTTTELAQLVEGVRFIETMIANPVNKDAMAKEMTPLRDLFGKSVVTRRDLAAGTILSPEHLTLKKPGNGIPAKRLPEIFNRKLKAAVAADTLLAEDDLE
ncbi:N-acetylneuraminate synthase family protein [Novipirellula sp.]|uniref:N-acetylneuraminate synthase family protein n=1 Tax=Novipirellula sp. TaxID=2795430 RepID=UPI00356701DE